MLIVFILVGLVINFFFGSGGLFRYYFITMGILGVAGIQDVMSDTPFPVVWYMFLLFVLFSIITVALVAINGEEQ